MGYKVSVVIPTYNRSKVLPNSIDSVLTQTYQDFELIIVDDGSIDDTASKVEKYLKDERVRYIQLEKNAGVSNARNVGVQNANGEWIAFHDSDDCWRPNKLEKQMEYLDSHPECKMVYSAYEFHVPGKEETIKVPMGIQTGNLVDSLLVANRVGAPTVVVDRNLYIELGGFDESFPALEDWDFAIKAAIATEVGYVDEPLVDVHYSDGSISGSTMNYYQARCMLIASYKSLLEKNNLFDAVVMEMFSSLEKYSQETIELIKKMLMKCLLEKM